MKWLLIPLSLFIVYLFWANQHLTISRYQIKAPAELRIVHLSDIHNNWSSSANRYLANKVRMLHPDLIIITGDLFDYHHSGSERGLQLAQWLIEIAPVYFIHGNHEVMLQDPGLDDQLRSRGVRVLVNQKESPVKGVTLIGLEDVDIIDIYDKQLQAEFLNEQLRQLADGKGYTILLSHQPQHFKLYCTYPVDLVLCGHAHGGQIRLPFTDGLYAPDQGLFPEYTSGRHEFNGTTMIVSRGIGRSLAPLRIFNDPEIVVLDLSDKE